MVSIPLTRAHQHGQADVAGLVADLAAKALAVDLVAHSGLTTSAHGGIVASTDARLSNARTPTAHAASHTNGGSDQIPNATTSPGGQGLMSNGDKQVVNNAVQGLGPNPRGLAIAGNPGQRVISLNLATGSADGAMSSTDKAKLDALSGFPTPSPGADYYKALIFSPAGGPNGSVAWGKVDFQYIAGGGPNGYVLTSNGAGSATWRPAGGLSAGSDYTVLTSYDGETTWQKLTSSHISAPYGYYYAVLQSDGYGGAEWQTLTPASISWGGGYNYGYLRANGDGTPNWSYINAADVNGSGNWGDVLVSQGYGGSTWTSMIGLIYNVFDGCQSYATPHSVPTVDGDGYWRMQSGYTGTYNGMQYVNGIAVGPD